jgi:hypothetical protein
VNVGVGGSASLVDVAVGGTGVFVGSWPFVGVGVAAAPTVIANPGPVASARSLCRTPCSSSYPEPPARSSPAAMAPVGIDAGRCLVVPAASEFAIQ